MVFHTLFITSSPKNCNRCGWQSCPKHNFWSSSASSKKPTQSSRQERTYHTLFMEKLPNSIPYLSCQNGWKTHIRKYPFRALISKPKRPVRVSSLCTAAPPLKRNGRGTSETRAQDQRQWKPAWSAVCWTEYFTIKRSKFFHLFVASFFQLRCWKWLENELSPLNPVDLCSAEGSSCAAEAWTELSNFSRNFWLLLDFCRELSTAYFLTRVFSKSRLENI